MESSYTITKYVQDNNGIVYKKMPNHLLKLSPWKDGEDRRIQERDIEGYTVINYKNACMIVNSQFDNTVEEWEHNGKKYIANALGNKNPFEHTFSHNPFMAERIRISTTSRRSTAQVKKAGRLCFHCRNKALFIFWLSFVMAITPLHAAASP